MKVVILNDCAAGDAEAITLLKGICDGISMRHEIEWVNIRELSAQPCVRCSKCQPHGECVLPEDDAHRVGRKIFGAGALVLGLSSSLENISASMSSLMDRIRGFLSFQSPEGDPCPWFEGRPVAIVCRQALDPTALCGSQRNLGECAGMPRILGNGGFRVVGALTACRDYSPAIATLPMDQARAVGRGLCLTH